MVKRQLEATEVSVKKKKKQVTSQADLSEEGGYSNGSESGLASSDHSDQLEEDSQDEISDEYEEDEEDEDADEDEDEENERVNGNGQIAVSGSKPHKQGLSAEDIQIARETSELFKSNIFKMQIDELLKEIKLEEKYTRRLDHILFKVNEIIKHGQPIRDLSLKEAERSVGQIVIPFAEPKPRDIKYKFGWDIPEKINVVGSYSLKTANKQPEGVGIDLVVIMPESLYQEKDYLNFRYFHKRAFYIAYLAKLLDESNNGLFTVKYAYQSDDPLKPMVQLRLTDSKLGKRFHINVLAGLPIDLFDLKKLDVDRNCIRLAGDHSVATTLYNSSLITDLSHQRYLKKLHSVKIKCAAFSEACQLGRLWLRQRGISASPKQGGFGHFEWAMVMASLLQGGPSGNKVLSYGYSSYQLFKGTLNFLAIHDLSSHKGGLAFDDTTTNKFTNNLSNEGFPLFYDKITRLNILYKMSRWGYSLLKHEAAITSDLLSDVVKDRFDQIFLHPVKDHFRYDLTFTLTVPTDDRAYSGLTKIQYLSPVRFWVNRLYRVFDRGFGNRVRQMAFLNLPSSTESDAITISPVSLSRNSKLELVIGLTLNSDECNKLITFGPSAEDEGAVKKFQGFWGKRSELRRFQDGSIREAVVWDSPFEGKNSPVTLQIVDYLVKTHMPEVKITHQISSSPFTSFVWKGVMQYHQAKYSAFQRAANMLQALDGLPLRVRAVHPTSSSLRYTSIDLPEPYNIQSDDGVASGLISFESSNKWPSEMDALEKTKNAFLLRMAKELVKNDSYDALVGVEKDFLPGVEVGFLQLQTPEGYSFKLRAVTDFDLVLLDRLVLEDPKNEKAKDLVEIYKEKYQYTVSHTRMIQTMALRYSYYSASCRLLKLWFREHLLLGLFKEEAVELLALKPFVDSGPYLPPSSPATALLRVLNFLSTWDWRGSPVVLDVANHVTGQGDRMNNRLTPLTGTEMELGLYQRLNDGFAKLREESDPALTLAPMVISTVTDSSGIAWTRQIPRSEVGRVVAARVSGLARAAMMLTSIDYRKIFAPSYQEYDVVIDLNEIKGDSDTEKRYKNLHIQKNHQFTDAEELIDDSVDILKQFYTDIQTRFSHTLVLFFGRSKICGLWHRDIVNPRKFKVNLEYSTIPVDSQNVELNKAAVVQEIRRIGGDLISNITVQ